MNKLFNEDPARFNHFHIHDSGLVLDYSKHRVTKETISLLVQLARACDLEGWRGDLFDGEVVNKSENRPALHTALRGSVAPSIEVNNENVSKFAKETLHKIELFSKDIRADKKITDVVNLGIGGSSIGPQMACEALDAYANGPRVHFVSNIDNPAFDSLLKKLKPESTLFIIVSKSFTTQETINNARRARHWITLHTGEDQTEHHFAAVTECEDKARAFGISAERIFPMRPWIGGRMSIWGAAGLSLCLAIGFNHFKKFLDGAAAMDNHFQNAPLEKNMPVIMALLGIWYRNFFDFRAQAVVPYAHGLRKFSVWLQQLEMESNGKSVNRFGETIDYATSPVIFGGSGTDSQHAFFQALHQGSDIVPCDFILINDKRNILLNANALAQSKGLMEGSLNTEEPHRHYPGNRPSSTLVLPELSPFTLGQLMALYEHKVFVQGVLWSINSFDQWGVELGKTLSGDINQAIDKKEENINFDSSTANLARLLSGQKPQ